VTEIKPTIAHLNSTFFSKTQTFIYNYLVKFIKTQPICISTGPIVNDRLFPFPSADLYSIYHHTFSPFWLFYNGVRLFTGRRVEVEKILSKREARLIHAHFGPVGYLLVNSKLKLRLPMVTTFYGADLNPSVRLYGIIRNWHKDLFKAGDLFLVEGAYMQQRLIELGCPPEKIQIQRIAIPVKEMPWRLRKKIVGRPTVVLFSGRFVEKKGLMYALEAVYELKQEGKSIEFRIAGDGPQEQQVKRFITDRKMTDYTRLLGFLNYKDYLQEMDKADIFLQPSIIAQNGETEGGAPTTILEAQAMGLPIVSTLHCDIPNVVVPGRSALLVEERNSSALANSLRDLLNHPSQWEAMGRIGRDYVQQYHDIEIEADRLEEKYFNLLM
jgi:colanic acid/amylovoran biosynthesis glycosyltransferase